LPCERIGRNGHDSHRRWQNPITIPAGAQSILPVLGWEREDPHLWNPEDRQKWNPIFPFILDIRRHKNPRRGELDPTFTHRTARKVVRESKMGTKSGYHLIPVFHRTHYHPHQRLLYERGRRSVTAWRGKLQSDRQSRCCERSPVKRSTGHHGG
jgi:hypothetical protein